jgi:hypothetical protein
MTTTIIAVPTIYIPPGCEVPSHCLCGKALPEPVREAIKKSLAAGLAREHKSCKALFAATPPALPAPSPEAPAFTTPPPARKPRSPAKAKKEIAIARAEEHADPKWLEDAHSALARVAARQERLTMDDVWAELERSGIPGPREPRASGAVVVNGVREGLIERVKGITAESQRESRNSGFLSVWRSLIFKPPA